MDQRSFKEGVDLFNRGEYFRCHEVFEELWTHSAQPERWFLQSLIHIAVALYHYQRGNRAGAVKQLGKGLHKIQGYLPEWGGLRTGEIERQSRKCLEAIQRDDPIGDLPQLLMLSAERAKGD